MRENGKHTHLHTHTDTHTYFVLGMYIECLFKKAKMGYCSLVKMYVTYRRRNQ